MRRLLLLGIVLTALLCVCNDDTPETAPVGFFPKQAPEEIVCSGSVPMLPKPSADDGKILPEPIIGLRTPDAEYILTHDGHWLIDGSITIAKRGYMPEERNDVKIIGVAGNKGSSASGEYPESVIRKIE